MYDLVGMLNMAYLRRRAVGGAMVGSGVCLCVLKISARQSEKGDRGTGLDSYREEAVNKQTTQ